MPPLSVDIRFKLLRVFRTGIPRTNVLKIIVQIISRVCEASFSVGGEGVINR